MYVLNFDEDSPAGSRKLRDTYGLRHALNHNRMRSVRSHWRFVPVDSRVGSRHTPHAPASYQIRAPSHTRSQQRFSGYRPAKAKPRPQTAGNERRKQRVTPSSRNDEIGDERVEAKTARRPHTACRASRVRHKHTASSNPSPKRSNNQEEQATQATTQDEGRAADPATLQASREKAEARVAMQFQKAMQTLLFKQRAEHSERRVRNELWLHGTMQKRRSSEFWLKIIQLVKVTHLLRRQLLFYRAVRKLQRQVRVWLFRRNASWFSNERNKFAIANIGWRLVLRLRCIRRRNAGKIIFNVIQETVATKFRLSLKGFKVAVRKIERLMLAYFACKHARLVALELMWERVLAELTAARRLRKARQTRRLNAKQAADKEKARQDGLKRKVRPPVSERKEQVSERKRVIARAQKLAHSRFRELKKKERKARQSREKERRPKAEQGERQPGEDGHENERVEEENEDEELEEEDAQDAHRRMLEAKRRRQGAEKEREELFTELTKFKKVLAHKQVQVAEKATRMIFTKARAEDATPKQRRQRRVQAKDVPVEALQALHARAAAAPASGSGEAPGGTLADSLADSLEEGLFVPGSRGSPESQTRWRKKRQAIEAADIAVAHGLSLIHAREKKREGKRESKLAGQQLHLQHPKPTSSWSTSSGSSSGCGSSSNASAAIPVSYALTMKHSFDVSRSGSRYGYGSAFFRSALQRIAEQIPEDEAEYEKQMQQEQMERARQAQREKEIAHMKAIGLLPDHAQHAAVPASIQWSQRGASSSSSASSSAAFSGQPEASALENKLQQEREHRRIVAVARRKRAALRRMVLGKVRRAVLEEHLRRNRARFAASPARKLQRLLALRKQLCREGVQLMTVRVLRQGMVRSQQLIERSQVQEGGKANMGVGAGNKQVRKQGAHGGIGTKQKEEDSYSDNDDKNDRKVVVASAPARVHRKLSVFLQSQHVQMESSAATKLKERWAVAELAAVDLSAEVKDRLSKNEDVPWPLFRLYCDCVGAGAGKRVAAAVERDPSRPSSVGTSMMEVVQMIDLADTLTNVLLSHTTIH